MRISFVLGFPNPFPGAGWTRIGFFAEDWSKRRHKVDVRGAFNCKSIQKEELENLVSSIRFRIRFKMVKLVFFWSLLVLSMLQIES